MIIFDCNIFPIVNLIKGLKGFIKSLKITSAVPLKKVKETRFIYKYLNKSICIHLIPTQASCNIEDFLVFFKGRHLKFCKGCWGWLKKIPGITLKISFESQRMGKCKLLHFLSKTLYKKWFCFKASKMLTVFPRTLNSLTSISDLNRLQSNLTLGHLISL